MTDLEKHAEAILDASRFWDGQSTPGEGSMLMVALRALRNEAFDAGVLAMQKEADRHCLAHQFSPAPYTSIRHAIKSITPASLRKV